MLAEKTQIVVIVKIVVKKNVKNHTIQYVDQDQGVEVNQVQYILANVHIKTVNVF